MKFPSFCPAAASHSIASRIAQGSLWSFVAAVASQGAALGVSVTVARIAGRDEFGAFGAVQSTILMLGVLGGLGLGLTATKYVAEYRESEPDRAASVIRLTSLTGLTSGAIAALGLYLWADGIAGSTFGDRSLGDLLRIGALSVFASTVNGCQTGALAGLENFKAIARINLAKACLLLPGSAIGVLLGGVRGALWAAGAVSLLTCVFSERELWTACKTSGLKNVGIAPRDWRILRDFSLPAVLSSSMIAPANWLINTMISAQPGGRGELAVWSAAFQWRCLLIFTPTLVGQVLVPVFASLGQTSGGQRRALNSGIALSGALAIPLAVLLYVCSGKFMSLYGAGFSDRGPVLQTVALTGAVLAAILPIGNAISASGRMWSAALMNAAWAAVLIVSMHFLNGRSRGADQAAIAHLIAYASLGIWSFFYWTRITGRTLRGGHSPELAARTGAVDVAGIR